MCNSRTPGDFRRLSCLIRAQDGKRMELERELEAAQADQEELEGLRTQVRTSCADSFGFEMSQNPPRSRFS